MHLSLLLSNTTSVEVINTILLFLSILFELVMVMLNITKLCLRTSIFLLSWYGITLGYF